MAALNKDKLREQLKRREFLPVYVLFGAETHLRDLAAKTIGDLAFNDGDLRDFNESEFSLNSEDNLQRAFAAAEQLPMMSQRRVIRICDVRVTASGRNDTIKEEHEATLKAYFERPSPTSIILFIADELNGVRKMGKLLRSQPSAVEFLSLNDGELTRLASDKFRENGCTIEQSSVRHLVALVGNNVRRITNEVNKLSAAAMPSGEIDIALIDSLVPHTRELTNFELTDQIVRQNKAGALKVLHKILDDGAEPVMLLGLISYNFRRLMMVSSMMSNGVERSEVARVMNLRYNDQEDFLRTARRIGTHSLANILKRIAETDLALKSSIGGGGPKGSRMLIETLVCELALA